MATVFEVAFAGLVAMVHPAGWNAGSPADHLTAILPNPSYSNKYSVVNPAVEPHYPRLTVPVRLGNKDVNALTAKWTRDPDEITTIPDSQGNLVQYASWDLSRKEVSFPGVDGKAVDTTAMTELFSLRELSVPDKVFAGYHEWPPRPQGSDAETPVSSLVRLSGGKISKTDDDRFGFEKGSTVIVKARPMAVTLKWRATTPTRKIHVQDQDGTFFEVEFTGNPDWTVPIEITNVCHCNVPAPNAPAYHFRAVYDLLTYGDRPAVTERLVPDQNQVVKPKPGALTHCVPQAMFSE